MNRFALTPLIARINGRGPLATREHPFLSGEGGFAELHAMGPHSTMVRHDGAVVTAGKF